MEERTILVGGQRGRAAKEAAMQAFQDEHYGPRRESSTCVRCGRALKDPGSVAAGMGPVCAGKASRSDSGALLSDTPVLNDCGTLEEVGLVCRRLEDGRVACNVPHIIKHHSPTGFEIGYGGSGPADLALNVLHLLMPAARGMDSGCRPAIARRVNFGGNWVSGDAERLHQDFKWKFIATMPSNGGRVPIEEIYEWLNSRIAAEVA